MVLQKDPRGALSGATERHDVKTKRKSIQSVPAERTCGELLTHTNLLAEFPWLKYMRTVKAVAAIAIREMTTTFLLEESANFPSKMP